MKKLIVIISAVIFVLACSVFAAEMAGVDVIDNIGEAVVNATNNDSAVITDDKVASDDQASVDNKPEKIADESEITDESAIYVSDNELTSYLLSCGDKYEVTGELETVYSMVNKYSPTTEELSYLTTLIKDGYDVGWVMDAYAFWTTCDEDISIIKSMCDVSEEKDITGKYWVEDAFNEATGYKHGSLSILQTTKYVNKGISIDDINSANILSRRGQYTITGILDRVVKGEKLSDIANEVYGTTVISDKNTDIGSEAISQISSVSRLSTKDTLMTYIKKEYDIETSDLGEASSEKGNKKIMTIEKKQEKNENKYIKSENINIKADKNLDNIKEEILKTMTTEEFEAACEHFSLTEIYNAINLANINKTTPSKILEENRSSGEYTKLLRKKVYLG